MKKVMSKFWAFILALFTVISCINYYPAQKVCAVTSADLSISQNGIAFIKECEGFSEYCYYDCAQSSIGYGTKCGTSAHSSKQHKITREQAEIDMLSEINNQYIPNIRKQTSGIQMNQSQFDALVSFTYNTGGGTTMIKNSPLVKFLRGELSESDARSQFANYVVTNSATGKVDQGLKNRRNKEADLFFSNPDPIPPSTPHPQISKGLYSADEIVEVTWNATENTTHYWLHTYKDGEDFENIDMYNNLSYARTYPAGNYTLYIASYNNYGETHDYVEFTVYDSVPESPEPKIEKSLYSSNETVTITWNDTANTTHYWLHTYKDGEDFENTDMYNNLSYSRTYPAGNYTLYISSYNNYGETHDCVEFTVYDTVPEKPTPNIEKKSYSINETVTITWNETQATDSYWLHIYRNGEDYINETLNQDLSFSAKYPSGNYTAYIVSCNSIGESISSIDFFVYNTPPEPPDPKINKDVYYSDETVKITWNEIANTDCYWLHIYRNGEEYINQTLNKALSYSAKYPIGNYTAYIASCNGMGETLSNVKFSVIESGDVNNDGKLTVADAVLLQKWLLAVPDTELVNWKAADLCEDDRLDVFDLCLMKRMLVENG